MDSVTPPPYVLPANPDEALDEPPPDSARAVAAADPPPAAEPLMDLAETVDDDALLVDENVLPRTELTEDQIAAFTARIFSANPPEWAAEVMRTIR